MQRPHYGACITHHVRIVPPLPLNERHNRPPPQCHGSVFASSEHLFPRLFPAFRNSRTGTTAARISSIKTFSRRSYTLMPREEGAGSGVPAHVHDQTPQLWSLSAPITPETTRVRSPVSLGVLVKSACEWRDGGEARGVVWAIGHATRRSEVGEEACRTNT